MARGGKREGAGRPAGSRNKLTRSQKATLTELAQSHTETAMMALLDVVTHGSDAARVSAAIAILDRGWGKPRQSVEVTETSSLAEQILAHARPFPVATERQTAPGDAG